MLSKFVLDIIYQVLSAISLSLKQNELLVRNYMPPILVSSPAKRIATQILGTAKLSGRKDFILRVFVCDIICPSKELPVQS